MPPADLLFDAAATQSPCGSFNRFDVDVDARFVAPAHGWACCRRAPAKLGNADAKGAHYVPIGRPDRSICRSEGVTSVEQRR